MPGIGWVSDHKAIILRKPFRVLYQNEIINSPKIWYVNFFVYTWTVI